MTLGKRLKAKLEETGLKQTELAKRLNISPTTLNGYFTDYREPDLNTLKRLADELNTTVDYLVTGDHSQSEEKPTQDITIGDNEIIDARLLRKIDKTETFGLRLNKCRKSKNLTQEDIAEYLNVGKNTVSRYENGERTPDFETLLKLAEYFNTSVSYLVGETDDPTAINEKSPLPIEEGDLLLTQALEETGLLDTDGHLSKKGEKIISEFIINNADMLKKLMNEPE